MTAVPLERIVDFALFQTLPSIGYTNKAAFYDLTTKEAHRRLLRLGQDEYKRYISLERSLADAKKRGSRAKHVVKGLIHALSDFKLGPFSVHVPVSTLDRLGPIGICRLTSMHEHMERLVREHAYKLPSQLLDSFAESDCPLCRKDKVWCCIRNEALKNCQYRCSSCATSVNFDYCRCQRESGNAGCGFQVLRGFPPSTGQKCSECDAESSPNCCPIMSSLDDAGHDTHLRCCFCREDEGDEKNVCGAIDISLFHCYGSGGACEMELTGERCRCDTPICQRCSVQKPGGFTCLECAGIAARPYSDNSDYEGP